MHTSEFFLIVLLSEILNLVVPGKFRNSKIVILQNYLQSDLFATRNDRSRSILVPHPGISNVNMSGSKVEVCSLRL